MDIDRINPFKTYENSKPTNLDINKSIAANQFDLKTEIDTYEELSSVTTGLIKEEKFWETNLNTTYINDDHKNALVKNEKETTPEREATPHKACSINQVMIKTENPDHNEEFFTISNANIKEEESWETNCNINESDPLKLDDNFIGGTIIKFEKEPISNEDNSFTCATILNETGEKKFICNICGKSYKYASNLSDHKMTHSGEKPHNCEICGKSFPRKSALHRHRLSHTGEKLHSCEICNKSFVHACHLKDHKVIHTGEKAYCCDICNKSFHRIGQLRGHKRMHTKERPYVCNVCSKTFVRSTNLARHKKIHSKYKGA